MEVGKREIVKRRIIVLSSLLSPKNGRMNATFLSKSKSRCWTKAERGHRATSDSVETETAQGGKAGKGRQS